MSSKISKNASKITQNTSKSLFSMVLSHFPTPTKNSKISKFFDFFTKNHHPGPPAPPPPPLLHDQILKKILCKIKIFHEMQKKKILVDEISHIDPEFCVEFDFRTRFAHRIFLINFPTTSGEERKKEREPESSLLIRLAFRH